MPDSAVDYQIQIALRDDKKRDEFAEHIAELASQIAKATIKFSQDVKDAYEKVPKRRLGDKNFDDIDQVKLTWVRSASSCMFWTDICCVWIPGL